MDYSTDRTLDKGVQGVKKLTFQDCFIYTCDLCGKRPASRSQLEVHLEEDHDQDTTFIQIQDEPPYRIRKLEYYKKKVRMVINCGYVNVKFCSAKKNCWYHSNFANLSLNSDVN